MRRLGGGAVVCPSVPVCMFVCGSTCGRLLFYVQRTPLFELLDPAGGGLFNIFNEMRPLPPTLPVKVRKMDQPPGGAASGSLYRKKRVDVTPSGALILRGSDTE